MPEPVYFTPANRDIVTLIKTQGAETCRNEIYQEILLESLQNFTGGFVILSDIAQIGQRRRSNRKMVEAFVLFRDVEISVRAKELFISLICSRNAIKKHGSLLMKSIFDFVCPNDRYRSISLESLPEDRLVNWYRKIGFEVIKSTYNDDPDQKVKVIQMIIGSDKLRQICFPS